MLMLNQVLAVSARGEGMGLPAIGRAPPVAKE